MPVCSLLILTLSPQFAHHISGLRARVKKKNSAKTKVESVSISVAAVFTDNRVQLTTPEATADDSTSSVFSVVFASRFSFLLLQLMQCSAFDAGFSSGPFFETSQSCSSGQTGLPFFVLCKVD